MIKEKKKEKKRDRNIWNKTPLRCKQQIGEGGKLQSQIRKSKPLVNTLSMDSQTYPGQGLSIPQLVFALKQEVRRAAYSPSYVTQVHCGLHSGALKLIF